MNEHRLLLVTPPFTQSNTPYPATPYLKGYFNTVGIVSYQADLGIEVLQDMFTPAFLEPHFRKLQEIRNTLPAHLRRMADRSELYLSTILPVVAYLQGRNHTLAHLISETDYLPRGSRFDEMDDVEWAFGAMGIHDKAKYLATLYLEDLADMIRETVDARFEFTKYAEHLGRSASSFDTLYAELNQPESEIDRLMWARLESHIEAARPDVLVLTIPFPGNLYTAFRCGQYIATHHPEITVVMGGGFVNTELRSLSDPRVFDYTRFILLDDGELALMRLLAYLDSGDKNLLVRTFVREDNRVVYCSDADAADVPMGDRGTPDYAGLPLDRYLSVLDMINPMHSLWSDGRWNKLTLAHGCYWGKCAFCDGSLDYIGRYEPDTAGRIADRMERLIEETGERGFHFVDEAAPPALLRDLAIEILKRRMSVVWWGNIRFEKSYTDDLCRLLKRSGCIAVSGGLEVASDRLLKLINKGVSVEQVAQVTRHFSDAGIWVHAYLMYGFPSETAQETVDSLEIVRQLFRHELVHSAFWHRFALTAHSPVGKDPDKYRLRIVEPPFGGFARNDIAFEDPVGDDPEIFGEGLRRSLFNYMRGVGFDVPLQKWFDEKVPRTTVPPTYIEYCLREKKPGATDFSGKRLLWIGLQPRMEKVVRNKKGKEIRSCRLSFLSGETEERVFVEEPLAVWLSEWLSRAKPGAAAVYGRDMEADYRSKGFGNIESLFVHPVWAVLRGQALLLL